MRVGGENARVLDGKKCGLNELVVVVVPEISEGNSGRPLEDRVGTEGTQTKGTFDGTSE